MSIIKFVLNKAFGGETGDRAVNNAALGQVKEISAKEGNPNSVMVTIFNGRHQVYENEDIWPVSLGVDLSRSDAELLSQGDYVEVVGIGFLGIHPKIKVLSKDDPRLEGLKKRLKVARNRPTDIILD